VQYSFTVLWGPPRVLIMYLCMLNEAIILSYSSHHWHNDLYNHPHFLPCTFICPQHVMPVAAGHWRTCQAPVDVQHLSQTSLYAMISTQVLLCPGQSMDRIISTQAN